jgi:ABC-type lipoprotein export system ATPase subunit
MKKMQFKVVPPRTKNVVVDASCFVLEGDNWNDFRYRTQYHLSFYKVDSNQEVEITLIGAVKILRKGQSTEDDLLITEDFESLDQNFCSIGQSLDYYERLSELDEIGDSVLNQLNDVVHTPSIAEDFKNEEGWSISLFRDQKDNGAQFIYLANGLIRGEYGKAPHDQQSFSFAIPGWDSKVEVSTSVNDEDLGFTKSPLPDRLSIFVGRNGSGKSTLLARLARVAYGSPDDQLNEPLKSLGALTPFGIGFSRVVTVAFSPFDSFILPGSDARNREQIAKDLKKGVGRFSFIGLRDLSAEFQLLNESPALPMSISKVSSSEDRVGLTRLKSIEQLTDEFLGFRQKILQKNRRVVLENALTLLEKGLFVSGFVEFEGSVELSEKSVAAWFQKLSTGHKITLLIVYGLVANLEPHSLVLIDEPETHLHPPLLAAMMHSVREILSVYKSCAVVATHSPVVVQESLAKHVQVVRREGELTKVTPVGIETFGESIGLITAQVFGMQSDAADFYGVLDNLVTRHKTLDKIEANFQNSSMSHQARAYVMSRLSNLEKSV